MPGLNNNIIMSGINESITSETSRTPRTSFVEP